MLLFSLVDLHTACPSARARIDLWFSAFALNPGGTGCTELFILDYRTSTHQIASHRIASHAHAAVSSITRRVTPPTACCAPHTHSRPAHPLPRPDIVLRSLIVFACASCSPGRQLNTSNRLLARAPTCGRLPSTSVACTPWSKPARGSPGMYVCLLVFPFPLVLLSCCVVPALVCAPVAIKIKKTPFVHDRRPCTHLTCFDSFLNPRLFLLRAGLYVQRNVRLQCLDIS
jgi:hypothetical protein